MAKSNATPEVDISVDATPPYSAIYISSRPRYSGGRDDLQFVHKAIIYPNR